MSVLIGGQTKTGSVFIDGVAQPSGGGGGGIPDAPNDGKLYARQSEAWAEANSSAIASVLFGAVETGLEQLDTSIGTLNTDLGNLTTEVDSFSPFIILDTSLAFGAATWTTVWTRTVGSGVVGELAIRNSLISTGTAATAACAQLRIFSCYRRTSGGGATAASGSLGTQTQGIAGASMRIIASGNDVQVQMQFTNAGTYFYRIPIYIHERTVP